MGFLDLALGAAVGMANAASQRQNRPSDPAIKRNIRLCYQALNMIDNYR